MTTQRRWVFIEEWDQSARIELIVTGLLAEEQLEALEAFVARHRARLARAEVVRTEPVSTNKGAV